MTATAPAARVVSARTPILHRLRDILRYRELLVGLVRKELKVKYKNSFLGFFWSMLNPALTLVVFYIVFQLVLKAGIPYFAIYLLSGVLVWNLFATGLPAATAAMVSNASLIKKVAFPREVLPLSSIGAALVHFFLQSLVLVAALIVFRYPVSPRFSLLLIPALLVLLVLLAGLGILLAAANVYLRDIQHLLELALLAWFWMTPIVYQYRLISDRLGRRAWVVFLNPLVAVVLSFQRAIYNRVDAHPAGGPVLHILPTTPSLRWYLIRLGAVGVGALVLLAIALSVFSRLEGNFAEEL